MLRLCIEEVRDKPLASYMGDAVVICKMDKKSKPINWKWYIQNGTNNVWWHII